MSVKSDKVCYYEALQYQINTFSLAFRNNNKKSLKNKQIKGLY